VDEDDALGDVEAGAAEELVDYRLGEAGGVVLDAYGLFGFVDGEVADSVDLADAGDRQDGGFCWLCVVTVENVELRHIVDFIRRAEGLGAEAVEVGDDGGGGPVLVADEFAAEDALLVDDVGLGDLDGAVEGIDALVGVADGEEVDVVLLEEGAVGGGVIVDADGDDGEAGHLVVEGEEAGELVDAGSAPTCPEVEEDDVAAEAGEVNGGGAVGEGELWGGEADAAGVVAAVAAGGDKQQRDEDGRKFRGGKSHHFL
jgi:hypothetical protein